MFVSSKNPFSILSRHLLLTSLLTSLVPVDLYYFVEFVVDDALLQRQPETTCQLIIGEEVVVLLIHVLKARLPLVRVLAVFKLFVYIS